jgi:EpsI family protein
VWISLYVGYYDRQVRGKTIHSPKNCLPGAGWAPVQSAVLSIDTPTGPVDVNRYLLQNENRLALVLYWYQGRGRVQANEYLVKWDLLRDAVLRQRTEEALVRIVVPVRGDDQAGALVAAREAAGRVIPALWSALPG